MLCDPRNKLAGVHPDLVRVINLGYQKSPIKFLITEGIRTKERQAQLVKAGASKTMKSRHLTGHAVDVAAIVDNEIRWDWPLYKTISQAVKAASMELGIPVEWGGDWKFKDGPHFQLPWVKYRFID